ncbi:MAG: queuosine salvage family protein [Solirubrobacterales bacterium]
MRAACAWVAERAALVRIERGAIEGYARDLEAAAAEFRGETGQAGGGVDPTAGTTEIGPADRETRAAFAICLNAINFGSGWWPTIRKRPGHSGFFTIAAGVAERFRGQGAWTTDELTGIDAAAIAATLGQDPAHPLMEQYAASLRDVGRRVGEEHGASFAALADAAAGLAPELADLLAAWPAFADASEYSGRRVPFFKRAQLAAADLDRAGVAPLADLDRLTAFADNLVPHVLRIDGVLRLDAGLLACLEGEELLEHGSTAEVELRACAVHAIELLAATTDGRLSPARLDQLLWNRGRGARYKALPRPRCRTTAY